MDVYNIQDIPNRFFYKKGKFVSPLTLVAEEGWFIVEVKYRSKILRSVKRCNILLIIELVSMG